MLLDGRRHCDRCKSHIPSGTHWFMVAHTGEEVCSSCLDLMHRRGEIPRTTIYDTLGDGGVRIFLDSGD